MSEGRNYSIVETVTTLLTTYLIVLVGSLENDSFAIRHCFFSPFLVVFLLLVFSLSSGNL